MLLLINYEKIIRFGPQILQNTSTCYVYPQTNSISSHLLYYSYSYMIDNIILLITGTLHQRAISELIPKCHPLGSFEQMEAIHIASTPAELYNAVLVDTPLGESSFANRCNSLSSMIQNLSKVDEI